MYKGKKVYCVYRLLYGEDFVKESINSVLKYVDKVFVFWSNEPFHKVKGVTYKGEYINFPKKFDDSVDIIKSIKSDKIVLINQHFKTNQNSFTKMYNETILTDYDECDILMMTEVDHVFREDQLKLALDEFIEKDIKVASTEQWEIWKGFRHCVPQWNDKKIEYKIPDFVKKLPQFKQKFKMGKRETTWEEWFNTHNPRIRVCTMFLNMEKYGMMPKTGAHCNPVDVFFEDPAFRLKARTHNFGFAVSEKTMYWKHLVSLAITHKIKDTEPYENWFEKIWLNWSPSMRNLEQSIGYEWYIPLCVPYNTEDLPVSIKNRFNL